MRTIKREQRTKLLEKYPHFTKELSTEETVQFIKYGWLPKHIQDDSKHKETFALWLNDELW